MESLRERIAKAVVAALEQRTVTIRGTVYPKPSGLLVHRNRRRPIEREQLPATLVYFLEEAVDVETHVSSTYGGAAGATRVLRVRLEHRATGEPDDQVLDPLVSWAVVALLADPSLGGLIESIAERRIQWDGDVEDRPYAGAGHDWEIEYTTAEDDPEG